MRSELSEVEIYWVKNLDNADQGVEMRRAGHEVPTSSNM